MNKNWIRFKQLVRSVTEGKKEVEAGRATVCTFKELTEKLSPKKQARIFKKATA